tara:strand:+ start:881 stop:2740 length:1860 start_codon:yes stop_codon:yes gene_type:complete
LIPKNFKYLILFVFAINTPVTIKGQISTKKYFVGPIIFEGNNSIVSNELKEILKLKEPQLWKTTEFNRRSLKLDAFNIRNYYISKGFLDVSVEESFNTQEDNSAIIIFNINEGLRSTVRSVIIKGNDSIERLQILRLLGLRIDHPLNLTGMSHNYKDLEFEYHRIGKLFFSMEHSYISGENIDLTLLIEEGPDTYIDSVIFNGLKEVDTLFVSRELAFNSGDRYNSERIQLSERQLFETSLFSLVDIIPSNSKRGNNWVNVNVDLRELSKRDLLIEPGFAHIPSSSSGGEPVSGIEGTIRLVDRNIYNTGIRLGLRSSIDLPIDALVNRGTVPAIFRSDLSLTNNWILKLRAPNTLKFFVDRGPELLRVDEPILRYGMEWTGIRRYSSQSFLRGGLSWTRIISDRMSFEQQAKEQQRSLSLKFRHRELDNLITPNDGWSLTIDSEIVGWLLGGTHDYYKFDFDYRNYKSLPQKRVFAFRTKIGRMDRLSEKSPYIPTYDLFYLGGSTSLRGWPAQRYLTKIVDEIERPVGGLIKVLISAELRMPLNSVFGMDFFIDGGILATSLGDLSEQVDYWQKGQGWNYGAELTISTPLGPIRFYYAIPLNSKKKGIFNLGVPYAF